MAFQRVKIQDVAREAGVSITTVSRYLNGRFDAMSEQTRERIAQVVERLNYQPNTLAQGLKGNRSRTVAVVVVNIGYPFCVSVIRSLSDVFTPAGYSLLVCETGGDAQRERKWLESLMAQQVDGIIMQTSGANNDFVERVATRIPVVFIDREFTLPQASCVVTNNEEASHQLTEALFATGYREILYVTEELQNVSTRIGRLEGYQKACQAQNQAPWVIQVDRAQPETFLKVLREVEVWADAKKSPFAVYTANGLLLLEIYRELMQSSLSVPHELGIATFDEPDWARLVTPQLTCVRQPTQEIGRIAANLVLCSIQEETVCKQDVRIVPSDVVMGPSTRLS